MILTEDNLPRLKALVSIIDKTALQLTEMFCMIFYYKTHLSLPVIKDYIKLTSNIIINKCLYSVGAKN